METEKNNEQEQKIINKRKIKFISVIGSPNVGKTTFSCQIAKYLSTKNKNVLVIFSDFTTPPLSFISEKSAFEEINSIGQIFSSSEINKTIIKKSLTLIKNSDYLAFLGLILGENEYSYPKFIDENIRKLYFNVKEIFDFIILDTSSITNNNLDTIGISQSDLIFRLKSQELKAIAYYESFKNISKNFIDENKVIDILNSYNSEYELHPMFNDIKYFLPYCEEVKNQLNYGKILKKLTSKIGEKYKKEIKKIVDEVVL